jgi:hypothetical protein
LEFLLLGSVAKVGFWPEVDPHIFELKVCYAEIAW